MLLIRVGVRAQATSLGARTGQGAQGGADAI